MSDQRYVVLYDADCGFCRWSLDKLLARDRYRRLRPVPLQSREADELLGPMDPERKMASLHLVAPDGTVRSAGEAMTEILTLLPGGRVPSAISGAVPGLTERAYRLVANNRTRLGKLIGTQACAVDPSARESSSKR